VGCWVGAVGAHHTPGSALGKSPSSRVFTRSGKSTAFWVNPNKARSELFVPSLSCHWSDGHVVGECEPSFGALPWYAKGIETRERRMRDGMVG